MRYTFFATVISITLIIGNWVHYRQAPQLSDQEMISSAINYFLVNQNESAIVLTEDRDGKTILYEVYKNPVELLDDYPNCCSFSYRGSEGWLPNFWQMWRFDYAGTVFVRAGRKKITGDLIENIPFHTRIEITMNKSGEVIPELRAF